MIERGREVELVEEEDVEKVRSLEAAGCAARVQALDNGDSKSSALQVLLVLSFESLGLLRATFNLNMYESFSDVGEIRVWFASKNPTPCRMH